MRRWLLAVLALAVLAGAAYLLLGRDGSVAPQRVAGPPVAAIGEGEEAVAVAADGTVLSWLPAGAAAGLPVLTLDAPPEGGRLGGPALEQVEVLAAVPPGLRPYLVAVRYGEDGVDVELSTGIDLLFGNSRQARRKWKAAAAALADPTVTALDYVNVSAPGHPAIGGSGHTLPPPP